ncbi:hypothetical protein BH10BAC1_BH10BAC1_21620 [soil metagenome]
MRNFKFIYIALLFLSCNSSNTEENESTANEPVAKPKISVSDSLNHKPPLNDSIGSSQKKNIGNKKVLKVYYDRYNSTVMLNGEPSRYDLNLPEKIYNLKPDTIQLILNRFYKDCEYSFPQSIACDFEHGTSTTNIIYPTVNFKVHLFENEYAKKTYKIVDYSIYSESDKLRNDAIAFSKLEPIYNCNLMNSSNEEKPSIFSYKQDIGLCLIDSCDIPKKIYELGISGTSWLTFIVEKNGSISDIRIEEGFKECKECDEEALRVAKSLPTLNPGKVDAQPVRVRVHQGISFPPMYSKRR